MRLENIGLRRIGLRPLPTNSATRGVLSGPRRLPFAIALFIGNVVSVLLLNYLVPWVSNRFAWWLQPDGTHARRTEIGGTIVLVGLYTLMVLVFWRLF